MRQWVCLLGAAFVVAACAEGVPTMRWSRPGATYEQFVADRETCVAQSQAQSSTYYLGGARYRGNPRVLDSGIFLPCMENHGYAPDPNGFAVPPGDDMPLSP